MMRRVAVPLDGSRLAEDIIPDARRLAGADGTLLLLRVVDERADRDAESAALTYLDERAARLRAEAVDVEVELLRAESVAEAIDRAASQMHASMIACSTHGRAFVGRLLHGSVAWDVLTRSAVPVLLRHAGVASSSTAPTERRILVPLDGSTQAEAALPVAAELAHEWNASILVVRVAMGLPIDEEVNRKTHNAYSDDEEVREAQIYVDRILRRLKGTDARADVPIGTEIAEKIMRAVGKWEITDMVMTTHGRTMPKLLFMGSVAQRLVQHLSIPLIVIPPNAVQAASAEREYGPREYAGYAGSQC
jgi:nucleotide-binding universal stress UspA family protein